MIVLPEILNDSIITALGWSIFHILWQGTLIVVLLGLTLRFLRRKSSQIRYLVSLTSLLFILGLSILNFHKNYSSNNEIVNTTELSTTDNRFKPLIIEYNQLDTDREYTTILSEIKDNIKNIDNYFPIIVNIWFIGVILLLVKFLLSYLYTDRLKRINIQCISKDWINKFEMLKEKLNINKTITYIESKLVKVPIVLGYFKPVIIIPVEMLSGIPSNQIEAIIAHELAHIRRNDYIINVLQTIIETIFFFHPAVWYISSKIRNERENCCDDIALTVCEGSIIYAKALVSIQELTLRKHYAAVAFSGRKKHLLNRIKRVIMKQKVKSNFTGKIIAALIILSGVLALSFTFKANVTNNISEIEVENQIAVESEKSNKEIKLNEAVLITDDYKERPIAFDTVKIRKNHSKSIDVDDKTVIKSYTNGKGKKHKMKFTLENGKVSDLYVDGEKIPESEYNKYQPEIDETIADLKEAKEDVREAMEEIENLDIERIHMEVEEAMKDVQIDMEKIQENIQIMMDESQQINTEKIIEEYEKSMQHLKERIDFNKEMEKWAETLENMEIEIFDYDEFIENISVINNKLEDINMDDFRKEIDESIQTIDVEKIMKELKKTREKLSHLEKEEILHQMDRALKMSEQTDRHRVIEELEEKLEKLEELELEEK